MLTPRILIQERDCPISMQNDSALKTNIDLLLEFLPLPSVYLWGHMTAVSREQSVIEGVVTFFVAFLSFCKGFCFPIKDIQVLSFGQSSARKA